MSFKMLLLEMIGNWLTTAESKPVVAEQVKLEREDICAGKEVEGETAREWVRKAGTGQCGDFGSGEASPETVG